MKPRIDFSKVSPPARQAMMGLQSYVNDSGLEHRLLELVKMRASQINGCAYCLDMHSKDSHGRLSRSGRFVPGATKGCAHHKPGRKSVANVRVCAV